MTVDERKQLREKTRKLRRYCNKRTLKPDLRKCKALLQNGDGNEMLKALFFGQTDKNHTARPGDDRDNFSNKSLAHHLQVMSEMYQRDKNRPGVIMWSVANEPATNKEAAGPYFKSVIGHVRALDSTRPVTFVCNQEYDTDKAIKYVDIILINRYYSWYSDVGHTELVQRQLEYDARKWHSTFNKPVIMSEYGADTIAGFHQEPSFVFTEEYQVEFLQQYHKAFDQLRQEFFVGEMVWNFADFMTVQGVTRVVGNKKGLLTRQRQPKASGHLIRARYMAIATGKVDLCRF